MESGAFRQALLKSERFRILIVLGSLGAVFIVHTIRTVIAPNREDLHFGSKAAWSPPSSSDMNF